MLMRFLMPLLIALGLALASPARAQSPCYASQLVLTDSLRAETYRKSSTGATLAPRATVVRRYANAIDSVAVACPWVRTDTVQKIVHDTVFVAAPKDSVAVSFDYTTGALWPGEIGAFPGGKTTMPLCASVMINGVWHLGDNAIDVMYLGRPDSVGMAPRPERDGTGLRAMCKPYPVGIPGNPPTFPDNHPTFPVRWAMKRITPFRGESPVWLPVPEPVIP